MTRIKNSLGSRVLALFLSFVMLFGLIPFNMMSVYAAGDQYGTLSGITAGGALTNADSSDATITYSSGAVLNWSPKNPSIGRNVDGWWIGVKMTAPDGMTDQDDFDGVTLKSKGSSNTWSDSIDFWACKDSDDGATVHFVELWGVINEEKLNDALSSGTTIQYQWKFDWNADGDYEQLATLIIDPNNIVLKKDEATVYPSVAGLGTVTAYTEGVTVSNGTGNYAGADFSSSATLSWVAADPSIGRTADGWWVGLKMAAPETLTTESDFNGVTLKAKGSSNEWSDAMPFWACKDSSNDATFHFVGLWGLVTDAYLENAVTNGRNVEYSWKFDWNKDGVYEQQVNLSIDPSMIILKDSEDNQVYPSLGTVTPYTGGTVSGVTGNITVTVDNTTLNWSPKDPSIGRTIDAWWVGVKVTAPDYTTSVLQSSKLKYKSTSTGEWSDVISFWDAKDSADGDAVQFVGLWMPLTPSKLAEAKEAGKNIVTEYQFDWNNDGVFEQLINVVVVPGSGIILNKVDQTGFGFNSNPNPLDQWAGATFTNTASGGQGTGSVTYKIVSDVDKIASIDKNTGTVTFSAAGTITVRATKDSDDTYNEATAEYTVTAVRYPQTEFKFQTTNPGTILYADGKTFENEASGGSGTGAIKYEIISGGSYAEINENTGVVTVIKAGDITVKATKAADSFYEATTATYNLKIDAGTQAPLSFDTLPANNELVYMTSAYEDVISVIGGSGTGAIKYSITTGKDLVASITPDGKITTLKAGQFTVHVEKEGDGGYNAATPIEVTLEVVKANQTTFAFTYPAPAAVTYNENENTFVNPAINGESTEAITYTIANAGGNDIVDVADNGTLTIKRAGEVTIRATKAADERYNAAQVEYTLVIQKADQTFSFADGNAVAKYYGIKSYKNEVIYTALTSKADGKGYGNGTVTYEVSGDVIGASVSTDGTVNFADSTLKAGTITVKAKKEADECYNEVEREYTLTVSYLPTPASSFSLSGETRNDSGWYTGDVTITPATGYKVSYSNNLSTDDWADTVVYGTQGTNSTNIYLINDEGSITDAIAVNDLQIDKTDPTNVDITYSTSLFDKIIETVTFGIYKAPVTVTLTAKNVYSGIESFTYNYSGTDIMVNKSDITFDDAGAATYSFTINPQYRGVVTMSATSTSGRSVNFTGDKTLVVDTMAPEFIVPEYTFSNDQVREYNSIYYTQGETKVKFTIDEANFDLSLKKADDEDAASAPVLTVNGVAQNVTWTQTDGTDEWVTEKTLSGDGDYVVRLTYTDRSTNAMESYTKEVHIDNVAPVFDVTYDNNEARNENNYKADRTATIKITEHNFKAEEVNLVVTAKDITGADVDISSKAYSDYAKVPANWTQSGDVWTLKTDGMKFDIDAIYHVELNYKDLAENDATTYTTDFVIDKTNPTNVKVEYSESIIDKVLETITFGFYQPRVIVTVTAQDDTSGVEYFNIKYTKQDGASAVNTDTYTTGEIVATQKTDAKNIFTAEHTIPANARGTVSIVLLDKAGNESEENNSTIAVVDNITPTREVIYTPEKVLDASTLLSVDSYQEGDNSILYYKNKAVVTFKINEANFDLSLKKADDEDVAPAPVIKVNNNPVSVEWSKEGDVWTAVHTITGDGDYIVTMTYVDRSTNAMVDYTSAKIAIDNTAPTISVAYNPAEATANEKFFKTNRSMTVTIDEHNFRADDIVVTVDAKDATGNIIANESDVANAISDYLKNRSNWSNTGDTHVATVPFTVDAQYNVTIDYSDLIGNVATQYVAPPFVVDHVAPSNLTISYSKEYKFWEEALDAITFGYYSYNNNEETSKPFSVTMTAFDDISGVDFFTWTYTQEVGTSTTNNVSTRTVTIPTEEITYSVDKKTATATFTLTGTDAEQFRGSISFTATDRAANESTKYDDNARINIVDTISPTRSVTYSGAKRVIDAKLLLDISPYEYKGENTNAILYYNDDATVTVKVNEANFYAKDVVIEDNGTKITPDNWTQSGDEWTATFTITDEGDHVVTMTYTDRSNNKMTNYESQLIVIDRTNPEISVDYKNSKIKNTVLDLENHNRQYFDDTQAATITINEHNFRPDDVLVKVKAKDVVGKNVATFTFDTDGNVNKYAEQGNSRDEWAKLTPFTDTVYTANTNKSNSAKCRRVGDTYQLEIEYANDANYTFDIEYTDLAGNKVVRSSDYFTVDKTAPKNLTVSYSTNIFEKVLESITFGYYNAQMTVTITAEDDTSGIYHFLYSYVKSEGVSGVNAELLDDAINNANISYDGAKATATFKIPKYVLANDNQFNGTVRFTAYDRSENSTDKSDTERIVVDSIKPTISVTYNDPVRNANNIYYYAGDADVTIDIHEANFYSEDVKVSVTRDGNNYPVTVKWINNSVDDHIGTFTLTEDGDYIVSVIYSDRSSNAMENYQSNRITVDKTKPTISTSAIKNNSANKDDTYTFTITANDTNIDFETFKPELKALVKNESGNYTVKSIQLGDIKTIEAGKTYSFTVQNLEEDAAYTLTCAVKDMSGNEFSSIKLDDGNEYETVRFSINRNGSTFAANEFTENLVEQYYVYSVDKDIVLEEINVDPIENYVVKLNGNVLEEGKDYTTSITNNDGEWSKRTYSIHKDLFNSEGEYSIVIESTDKAETKAYSDVKNLKIAFVVDQTAPVLTVSGVEDGGRYQIDEQPVTVIPTDDGGRLFSFKAVVLDSNGNPLTKDGKDISVRFDMSGEELLNYLEEHEGKIVFTIPEGLENQVQLICNDCAAKADGSTNEYSYTYKKVTVSQSGWVIFYANKPLFYGSIGGVVGVSGLATGLIIFFKKRKLVKTAK